MPHTRRIEPNTGFEFIILDDEGIALDPNTTYPFVEGARHELAWKAEHGELDPARTYRVVWRPTPQEWREVST